MRSDRPKPTLSLIQPPAGVEIAADCLKAAVEMLESPPPTGLGKKAGEKANLLRLGKAHSIARAVDWTAFEWFWAQGGREWEWRHDKAAHALHLTGHGGPQRPQSR